MPGSISGQEHLIETNIRWLRQASTLLDGVSDAAYATPPPGLAPHCVGGHMRHILEFYGCYLEGAASGAIDYDARQRDPVLETSRLAAQDRIHATIERLQSQASFPGDSTLRVRPEDSMACDGPAPFLVSSMGRELQVLSSHTIHHFALISVVLRAHGVPVDPDFGMAPSTLRYLAGRRAAEAA